jgi:predicted PurR-regulated permease PerM
VSVSGTAFGIMGALLAVPATVAAGVLVRELWFRRLEEDPGVPKERQG